MSAEPTPDARRVAILRVVLDVVRREGYAKANIRDITAALGVSTGYLHHHFAGRQALLAEAFELAAVEELDAMRRAIAAQPTPTSALVALLDLYRPSDVDDDTFVIWHDARAEAVRNPVMRKITARLATAWVEIFEDVLAAGVSAGEITCLDCAASAYRLLAVVDGLANHVVLHRTLDPERFSEYARAAAELETGVTLPRGRS